MQWLVVVVGEYEVVVVVLEMRIGTPERTPEMNPELAARKSVLVYGVVR